MYVFPLTILFKSCHKQALFNPIYTKEEGIVKCVITETQTYPHCFFFIFCLLVSNLTFIINFLLSLFSDWQPSAEKLISGSIAVAAGQTSIPNPRNTTGAYKVCATYSRKEKQ